MITFRFWTWMREIEGFIRLIWQFLEEFFEIIQLNLNTGTAPVWTAYGRVGGN